MNNEHFMKSINISKEYLLQTYDLFNNLFCHHFCNNKKQNLVSNLSSIMNPQQIN